MLIQKADVVIIGGGVIGTSIFYHLAKNKIDVVLLEKNSIASGTSGASEGIIFLQTKKPGILLEMALRSAEIFESLEEELGYKIEYVSNGGMVVIPDQTQYKIMKDFVREQNKSGLNVQLLNSTEARNKQPALSDTIAGSTFCSADAQVNPILLSYGFLEAATRYKNAKFFTHTNVIGIKKKGQSIEGVVTNKGTVQTNIVINAAGVYAPEIGSMVNLNIPIKPRRGQILVTEEVPNIIQGILCTSDYIACKYDPKITKNNGAGLTVERTNFGNYLIGATREFVGFDLKVTHDGMQWIARNLVSLIPGFKNVSVIRCFAGLRPYTEDGLPILGRVEGVDGFIMAAGHEGDGIALSPITGRIINELILKGKSSIPLDSFSLSRFNR
jgi:glycine/D-amino acid oxidase-like deaminating enzyme